MIDLVIPALLFVIVFQYLTIQKLVNKLMARNLHEYKVAEGLNKEVKIKLQEQDPPEDLRHLNELTL